MIFSLPPALSKQEAIERVELHVTLIKFDFGWGKPWWAVIRANVRKAPVSSRDRIFRGRAAAHRIAEAPGSLHLPVPHQGLSSPVQMISLYCLIAGSFWLLMHSHCFIIWALYFPKFSALSGLIQKTRLTFAIAPELFLYSSQQAPYKKVTNKYSTHEI